MGRKKDAATAIGLLGFIGCCCVVLFVPGIMLLIAANASYGHWEAVPAKILNTTYCGTLNTTTGNIATSNATNTTIFVRGRELRQLLVGHEHYESRILLDRKKDGKVSIHHILPLESRSILHQSFALEAIEQDKLAEKEEDHDSDEDIDDDEEDDDREAEPADDIPKSDSQAKYVVFVSHKRIANRKARTRRRQLQQQFPDIQRRAKVAGAAGAGAAGGYYFGSRRKSTSATGPIYSVTYSFTTTDGQELNATTDYCTSPVPPVGGTEMILYNPLNPSVGVISEGYYESLHTSGWLLIGISLLFILVLGAAVVALIKTIMDSIKLNRLLSSNDHDTVASTHAPPSESFHTYSDNPHDKVENSYGTPPSYGEPVAQATPANNGPIPYTSSAYNPPS